MNQTIPPAISNSELTRTLLLEADTMDNPSKTKLTCLLAKQCTGEWLTEAPLSDICFAFACLYRADKTLLCGEQFALLANRLIAAEVAPGGPYRNDEPMLSLNAAIAYLFVCMGKRLAGCQDFLYKEIAHTPVRDPLLMFAMRSLHLIDNGATPQTGKPVSDTGSPYDQTKRLVYRALFRDLASFPAVIQDSARLIAKQVERTDRDNEIACMGFIAHDSLPSTVTSSTALQRFGVANVYCWMAYMLYDDLIDGSNDTASLPIAGACLRKSYELYLAQTKSQPDNFAVVRNAFDQADYANAWEITNAKASMSRDGRRIYLSALPDYKDHAILASRSLPHILAPLLIARNVPATCDTDMSAYDQAWKQYLIAKQLNDDLHDWKEDLQSGSLSAVVCDILCTAQPGAYRVEELLRQAQITFWQRTMQSISSQILRHIELSRHYFQTSRLCMTDSPVTALLDHLEASVRQSSTIHRDHQSFLSTYRSSSQTP